MSTKIPPIEFPEDDPGNEIMFGSHTVAWYKWAAWFSQKVVASRAMSHLETAERAFTILCKGDELGLKPFAAWTWIYTTKAGRLAIMSKGALAVVQATPAFDGYEERIEGEGKEMRAVAVARRKGFPPTIKEFTYQDAEVAGLLRPGRTRDGGSYDTTYQAYLKDMLLSRARGRVLDIAFAAELGGIVMEGIAEDADDMDARRNAKKTQEGEPNLPNALPPKRDPLLASLAPKVQAPQLVAGEPELLDPSLVKVIADQVDEMFVSGPPPAAQPGPGKPTPAVGVGEVKPKASAEDKRRQAAGKTAGPGPGGGKLGAVLVGGCERCSHKLNGMGGCDVCGWPGEDIR